MRYPASEKLEIIRLVEQSHLPARKTLEKLGVPRATFYRWCDLHQTGGLEALEDKSPKPSRMAALERQLKKGDKSLVGNKGYRRFLATPDDDHFVIDRAKAEEELCWIFGDGVNQAADFFSDATSIPSRNVTPLTTFGN